MIMNISDFSNSDDKFIVTYAVMESGRGRGHERLWSGTISDSDGPDDTMPENWSIGRGRTVPMSSATSVGNLQGRARGRGRRTAGSSRPDFGPSF